jgi:hypothetical protein
MSNFNPTFSTLDAVERHEEALRICKILEDYQDELRSNEVDIISRVQDNAPVSTKMLFWLRDIKDRVL